jgi:two-component system chemotaxis response regulator CheB
MDDSGNGPRRDLVVIGGSAGGVDAVATLLGSLSPSLPAAVVVVLHRPAVVSGNLRHVLNRSSAVPVVDAGHDQPLVPGQVYLAPPGVHVLVRPDRLLLSRTARVNRVRPAADPLFRSAARWFGARTVGVVLSGALDDGAAGLGAIWARGGACLVQDPNDALFAGMPYAAMLAVPGATVLPVNELGRSVLELAGVPAAQPDGSVMSEDPRPGVDVDPPETETDPGPGLDLLVETALTEGIDVGDGGQRPGRAVPIACPDCRGAMTRIDSAGATHYRCHVGHSFSPQTLVAAQSDGAESALWTAVSILEEQAELHRTLALRLTGDRAAAHLVRAGLADDGADAIRHTITLVVRQDGVGPEPI